MPEGLRPHEARIFDEGAENKKVDIISLSTWQREISAALESTDKTEQESYHFALQAIQKFASKIYKGKEQDLEILLANLQGKDYKSREEFVTAISREMHQFGEAMFTPRELEYNLRHYVIDRQGHILNEALHYEVNGGDIYLHVCPISTLSIGEKLKFLREGFRDLATQIKTQEHLKNAKTINATSWIIAKNPTVLERLGFTYDGEISEEEREEEFPEDTRKIGKAHIDVDKFLELYSSPA